MYKLLAAVGLVAASQALDLYSENGVVSYADADVDLMAYEPDEDDEGVQQGGFPEFESHTSRRGARLRRRALRRQQRISRRGRRRQFRRGNRNRYDYWLFSK